MESQKRGKKLPKRTGQRGKKAAHGSKRTTARKRSKSPKTWRVRANGVNYDTLNTGIVNR